MNRDVPQFDWVVVGSGPAGHKSAIAAAKGGARVLLIEEESGLGGACVHRGTIPSKTLREAALAFANFRAVTNKVYEVSAPEHVQVAALMTRLDEVVGAHERFMSAQAERHNIALWHGRARFVEPHVVEVRDVHGKTRGARAAHVLIATGSKPRTPDNIPVDHENILDSDSLLSMTYLPRSLVVLGAGVIASEYASIFASLGVKVTMIDKGPRPLGFLDSELVDIFVRDFEAQGTGESRYLGGRKIESVEWDGVESVVTKLTTGEEIRSDKLVLALGRVAQLDGLNLEAAGLAPNKNGLIDVNSNFQTAVPHIYAAGDVIGPPSLASTSMDQGRRAACHALKIAVAEPIELVPMGVYTIPEISSVGLSEAQAREKFGDVVVGRAHFSELARGQIACAPTGLLKLVASAETGKLLGIQVVGPQASEVIHVGQMALLANMDLDVFVNHTFNFPTLAEGYRVAALEMLSANPGLSAPGAGAATS